MRYDYRTKYKKMDIQELKKHLEYNKKRYDLFFINDNSEIAESYYRVYIYLKSKIEKMETVN